MTDDASDQPEWNTNVLWGILAVFLVVGSVGGATFVYGLMDVAGGSWAGAVLAAVGGIIAFLAFLFMAGILYRVDRYRGKTDRRVELFE